MTDDSPTALLRIDDNPTLYEIESLEDADSFVARIGPGRVEAEFVPTESHTIPVYTHTIRRPTWDDNMLEVEIGGIDWTFQKAENEVVHGLWKRGVKARLVEV